MIQNMEDRAKRIAQRVALDDAIACQSDKYASSAKSYAEQLTQTGLDKTKTQVRSLETLAYTTDKVSDVTDWLRIRVGRDEKRNRWAQDGIGRELLAMLEGLRSDARNLVASVKKEHPLPEVDADLERQVHLRLIREYLKHLTAHFEYVLSVGWIIGHVSKIC